LPAAIFRFYAALNDFLPQCQRGSRLRYDFNGNPAVKDAIEALGIPHPEVDLLLINGEPVDFQALLNDGDHISVFPRFGCFPVGDVSRVKPPDLDEARFVLDVHLGRLAERLRMLGFDAWYSNQADDAELAHRSSREQRILLTRDRGLLKRSEVVYGYCVRSLDPRAQVLEVLNRFALWDLFQPFKRCTACNGLIHPASKDAVLDRLLPGTREAYDAFYACDRCGKVYWEGMHVDEMREWIESLRAARRGNDGHGC